MVRSIWGKQGSRFCFAMAFFKHISTKQKDGGLELDIKTRW